MITEDMVRAAAEAIYNVWAKNREVEATWEECSRLKHSIAREAEEEGRAAITAALAAMWQESPPAKGPYLVYQPEHISGRSKLPARICLDKDAGFFRQATHYMPLPPAPTLLSTRMGSEKTAEG